MSTTRDRILDAAWTIVHRDGSALATTKRIAAEAGVAEGTLYNHFADKADLTIALVLERSGDVRGVFGTLRAAAGTGDPRAHMAEAVADLIAFYDRLQRIISGIFADTALLDLLRRKFTETGKGPQMANLRLSQFIAGEQAAGRLDPGRDPEALAALLVGAAHDRAFLDAISGAKSTAAARSAAARSLVAALFPDPPVA